MTDDPESPNTPADDGSNEPGSVQQRLRAGRRRACARAWPSAATRCSWGSANSSPALRRTVLRDPLSLFLLLASIGLAIAFALLLGSIKPSSSGMEVPLSTVQKLAKQHEIDSALLLDHDDRVELITTAGGSRRSHWHDRRRRPWPNRHPGRRVRARKPG